jgi:hypothetical protein
MLCLYRNGQLFEYNDFKIISHYCFHINSSFVLSCANQQNVTLLLDVITTGNIFDHTTDVITTGNIFDHTVDVITTGNIFDHTTDVITTGNIFDHTAH